MGLKGVDGVAGQPAPPRAIKEEGVAANGEPSADAGEAVSDRMPGALEAAEGGAPEVTVHKEESVANASELSPEEQAVNVSSAEPTPGDVPAADDDDDAEAALAEGRVQPPVTEQGGTA
jgi:hypothetical protein